jgi:hypothetical protein
MSPSAAPRPNPSLIAEAYAQGELSRYRALYELTRRQGLSKQAAHQALDRAVDQSQDQEPSPCPN